MKKAASGGPAERKTFLINLVGRQNATWQGTITLIDRKATHATKLPRPDLGADDEGAETLFDSRETFSFRSTLELIHLIESTFEEGENGARG
jgi:hypothetical protein